MATAVLKYFLIGDHFAAVLAVQHPPFAQAYVRGGVPTRTTTVDYCDPYGVDDAVTVFELSIDANTFERLEVLVDERQLASFGLIFDEQRFVALPGPHETSSSARAQFVPWF